MARIKIILSGLLLLLSSTWAVAQTCSASISNNFAIGFCKYSTVTFSAVNQVQGATYDWSAAGCVIVEDNGPSVKVYFPNEGNHTLTLQQNCPLSGGFPTTQTRNIYVHTGTQPSGYNGVVADTRDTVIAGVPKNVGYTWNYVPFPNHTTGYPLLYPTPTAQVGVGSSMIMNPPSGPHTDSLLQTFPATYSTAKYGLAVERWNGCADTVYNFTYVLGAIQGPLANCQSDIVNYVLPLGTVNLWTVTGGTILSGQGTNTVQVQWTTVGSGTVQCDWTHANLGSQSTSRSITVGSSATPVITGNATLCNSSQGYSVPNIAGHSYRWTVNGVNRSSSSSFGLAADNQGTYNLVVYDSIGTCVNSASLTVTNPIVPHPVVSSMATVCQGASLTLSVAAVPGATYAWSTPGATVVSGAGTNAITIKPTNYGFITYSVTVTVSGCSRTSQKIVEVLGSLAPNLGPDIGLCAGNTATLTNSNYASGFLISYTGSPGYNSGLSMTASTPGIYWMQATVYHNSATCVSRDTVIVANGGLVNLGPDQVLCSVPSTTLTPTFSGAVGPYTYAWSTAATTPTITVGVGIYDVTVTAPSGCSAADTIVVSGPSMPPVSMPSNVDLCPGGSLLLDAGPGYATYLWSTGATTQTILVTMPGNYSVTATDPTGCSSSTSTSVLFAPAPSTILGMDTTICPDTFAVFNSAPFASYIWSTGAFTGSIQATTAGTYTITVTDVNGCVWTDDVTLTLNPDCIWPGDANHDGVADNADILSIGFAMPATGPTRVNAGITWYGQVCNNWSQSFPSSLNYKHADSDGNGSADFPDTLVVMQNYGLTHNKGAGTSTGPALTIVPLQPSFTVGDVVDMAIHLGDAGIPANGVNGIAFSVTVGGITTAPGDVWFSFPPSFLGTVGTDALAVGFEDVAPGRHDVGNGRIGVSPVSGHGQIALMHIRTDSMMLPNAQNALTFNFSGVLLVGDSLQPLPISAVQGGVSVIGTGVSVEPGAWSDIVVFPIPSDEILHLRRSEAAEVLEIEVFDLAGKLCYRQSMDGLVLDLPTWYWSNGAYLLTAKGSKGTIMREKVLVLHGE